MTKRKTKTQGQIIGDRQGRRIDNDSRKDKHKGR